MGFLALVAGICSSVGAFLSSAVAAVCSVATTIGVALEKYLPVLSAIFQAIGTISQFLNKDETIEVRGEKVLQASQLEENPVTMESCSNFEEYKKKIDEFEIDEDKKHSPAERQLAGIAYVTAGISSSAPCLNNFSSLYPVIAAQNRFFNGERLQSYIDTAKMLGFELGSVRGYFDGNIPSAEMEKTEKFLLAAEQRYCENTGQPYSHDEALLTLSDAVINYRALSN